ncbi:MAG: phosphonate metabolism protein/1,5-bisphosphokinase (PRPP-forming) PhnN [Polaromonas sp.]|uniref:phosphonate metabolism protein/1,5-bisphosphokinase (PRPP-forming) PhnN n=1 Tax=Polaromonas sp. TaxID=1869339 RepID=UPI00272F6C05|nr:phosphonate metabolism protein/1,5-bisphosphokinase (PRPP-forming) PhnN [Polaromonas sp.]MDP2448129.1 phosphonate metabolism protein/1,5-bisphosphokinase (PRPP-forming) PhnN [Polaromonas sp.]MDP3246485.1 phosphonate metabolism protein/1,5-bisphosphokinase (PRPP-forming) PhnN [Polaromonas sp.]MDP3756209.1 phosphonate metabolism protein/1,5-bisphosphokinase (PRPP-forming) PhnN [Polaromonas sp.]
MSGLWVFVCGPSGSGKDSVIDAARQALVGRSDIVFARRMVTRPVQPGSDHDPVTAPVFAGLLQAGGLCWHWQAHGFSYGIASHYADAVRAGCLVVVNGSRAHVNSLPPSSDLRVVRISTDLERLAIRLAQRGRDSDTAVAERLARNATFAGMQADCVIVNNEALAVAGQRLADYLTGSARPTEAACSRITR